MENLPSITINGVDLAAIEAQGQRVVTLGMVDRVHQRVDGTARKRFNDNRARFIEGEDFFVVSHPSEIRTLGLQRQDGSTPASITLLTESGYLMLVKSFTDDLAWEVQRKLVNAYFRAKPAAPQFPVPQTMGEALRLAADLSDQVEAQKAQLAEAAPKVAFHDRVTNAVNAQTIQEAAKTMGVGPNKLFKLLRDHGLLMKGNLPYQKHIDAGHFRVIEGSYRDSKRGENYTYTRTLVTGKGFAYIQRTLADHLPPPPPAGFGTEGARGLA